MTSYRVRWEIDIEADSPAEAAREALRIQRDFGSEATVFEVAATLNPEPREFTPIDAASYKECGPCGNPANFDVSPEGQACNICGARDCTVWVDEISVREDYKREDTDCPVCGHVDSGYTCIHKQQNGLAKRRKGARDEQYTEN